SLCSSSSFISPLPPLSLHDALPILFLTPTSDKHIFVDAGSNLNVADEYPLGTRKGPLTVYTVGYAVSAHYYRHPDGWQLGEPGGDRKSTRLNSSHGSISYAVFRLKK